MKRPRIRNILVPIDFSASSLEALKEAIAFADRVAAGIVVMHAVDLGLPLASEGYWMYDLTTLIDGAKDGAQEQMRSFVRRAKFGGVRFETIIQVGPPVSEICPLTETKNIDLIITATHGRTGFERLLMGSVAEQIVRYAPRSVLVAPRIRRNVQKELRAPQNHAAHPESGTDPRSCGSLS